jgi:ATP-dependent DNA helicase DinG
LEEAGVFFGELLKYRQSKEYRARLKRPNVVSCSKLCDLLGEVSGLYAKASATQKFNANLMQDLTKASARCAELSRQITTALAVNDTEYVSYIEEQPAGYARLCRKPCSVAEPLKDKLFDKTSTVVLTSATLVSDNSFNFIIAETGAPSPRLLKVESPFNFVDQAKLIAYRATKANGEFLDNPNDPEFAMSLPVTFEKIITLAQGRTLGLFTSYRNLNLVYNYIKGNGFNVLCQGQGTNRSDLIQQFKEDVHSVLLGTDSFWTGVDIPGESLSCLVIDKFPFLPPDDPIVDLLGSLNSNSFWDYSVPKAVISFRQGFGRLIRTQTDKGVAVILDPRFLTKSWAKKFGDSLPLMEMSTDLDDIKVFLGARTKVGGNETF